MSTTKIDRKHFLTLARAAEREAAAYLKAGDLYNARLQAQAAAEYWSILERYA